MWPRTPVRPARQRWTRRLAPLLGAAFLLLWLVPAASAPRPAPQALAPPRPGPVVLAPADAPIELKAAPLPDWSGPLESAYAICPVQFALPAPFSVVQT
jgi:hypothetical protein